MTQSVPEFDRSLGEVPVLPDENPEYRDDRGLFTEAWNSTKQNRPGFVSQINRSVSARNTLRGMHWQVPPHAAGKYVICLRGQIQDVVVDLRKSSRTFGKWRSYTLGGILWQNLVSSLWVPPGFAHGFLVVEGTADVVYLQSGQYHPESERSLRYNDPDVGISWWREFPNEPLILSTKDEQAPFLKDLKDDDLFT